MISFNNVSDALYIPEEQIKDIYKASKGKSKREEAAEVKADIEKHRRILDKKLKNNSFIPRRHNTKIIQENSCKKTRKIVKPKYMYEQMAHHSVMRVFVPIAMRGMYYHVYGSIPGKGVHRGKGRLKDGYGRTAGIANIFINWISGISLKAYRIGG